MGEARLRYYDAGRYGPALPQIMDLMRLIEEMAGSATD